MLLDKSVECGDVIGQVIMFLTSAKFNIQQLKVQG